MPNTIKTKVFTATIGSGDSLSAAVSLGQYNMVGLVLPTGAASFDALTEALLFHVSADDTTFSALKSPGNVAEAVIIAPANTNGAPWLDPARFVGRTSVKIGTYKADLTTAVAQAGGARTIKIIGAIVAG